MARVGLLGGTFNPPHVGHMICAQEALSALDLDRSLLQPARDGRAGRVDIPHAAVEELVFPDGELVRVPGPDERHIRAGADRTIFDSGPGGTGRAFDWGLVEDHGELARGILAGGIHAGNAREAEAVGAFAIDVGSGVEAAPGRKDAAKVEALFAALRPQSRRSACA